MAIVVSDIKTRLSTKLGSAGNTRTQLDPNASLGKYISQTDWAGGSLHDLFDVLTGEQNATGQVDYRCIFVYNTHGTLTYEAVKVWISAATPDGASLALGIDPAAASAVGALSAQAASITTATTAPAGVAFSSPVSFGAGLSLGDIPPGQCRAIWVRRTANNSTPVNNDVFTLSIQGDTAA